MWYECYLLKFLSGLHRLIKITVIEGPGVTRYFTHRLVELKLDYKADEITEMDTQTDRTCIFSDNMNFCRIYILSHP